MIVDDNNKFMEILNQQPFIINNLRNKDLADYSLLMQAAYGGIDQWRILINIDQDFSIVDGEGRNVFYWIDGYDDKCNERLNDLLIRQVDGVNNSNGWALRYAAKYNYHKSIRTLIRFTDIDVNIRDDYDGRLPEEDEDCDETTKQIIREFRQK